MSDQTTINSLIESVESEVEERAAELLADEYPEDILFEIADSWIPIYNGELAECLADDPGLAFVDDEGLVDLSKGVFHVIQVAIYERLIGAAYEAWERVKEQAEDDEE